MNTNNNSNKSNSNNNGTSLNSLKMNKGEGEEKEEGEGYSKVSHRDCIKKYFNISSYPLNLNIALKHINSCSICKNEIERINNNAKFKYQNQDNRDCKSCNYATNKYSLVNKIDEITNKVNTLTNGLGHSPIQGYNLGQNFDYINYKINDAVRTSVNDAVRTSVNEAVRTSINEAIRTSVNDMVNKKMEHFGSRNDNSNNFLSGNNTFITVSIVIIIILLLIDIYLRINK
jgi:hypothetical protein